MATKKRKKKRSAAQKAATKRMLAARRRIAERVAKGKTTKRKNAAKRNARRQRSTHHGEIHKGLQVARLASSLNFKEALKVKKENPNLDLQDAFAVVDSRNSHFKRARTRRTRSGRAIPMDS